MSTIDWKTIQQHYNNHKDLECICSTSDLFERLWSEQETHNHIRHLANTFLLETNQPQHLKVGVAYLFNYEESLEQARTTREQFLQWCIDNNKQ